MVDFGNKSLVFRSELASKRTTPRFEQQNYYRDRPDNKQAALFHHTAHSRQPRIERESSLPTRNNSQRREPIRIETANYDHIYRAKPLVDNLRYSTETDGNYDRRKSVRSNTKQYRIKQY